MAYTKYSLTPADNNSAAPNGAPEGMLPSGVNDTMRDMMAQIRDVGDGIRGGTYTMTAPVITGGTITGITDLAVADGGTGRSTLTAKYLIVGNGTSPVTFIPTSVAGYVLTSAGLTGGWVAAAPPTRIGSGQTWQDVTSSRSSGTTYTNSTGTAIQISIVIIATGSDQGSLVINGVTAVSSIVGATNATHQYSFIIPDENTYVLTLTGGSVNRWLELR